MSLKSTAFFRFDASPKLGAGHAIRCSVIADVLVEKNWVCKIVTSFETYDFIKDLKRFERVDPSGFYDTHPQGDLLVIDHYDLDEQYERHFRPFVKKIMVIDDLANRKHDCDILLNQNFGFTASDYQHLVSKQCSLVLGIEHCIVNLTYYQDSRNRQSFDNILFYMGGSGKLQRISDVAIECSKKYKVGFVEGFLNNSKETRLTNIGVSFSANQIKQAYQWSDVSIGFAGQGMFERYVMGIPMLIFSQNELQHSVLRKIQDNNVIYCGDIRDISISLISKKMDQIKETYQYIKCVPNLSFLNDILK